MRLSIVIPVYNERDTILKILDAVDSIEIPDVAKEIIIVDDYSTDGTRTILQGLEHRYKILFQSLNQGKGAALRRGYESSYW